MTNSHEQAVERAFGLLRDYIHAAGGEPDHERDLAEALLAWNTRSTGEVVAWLSESEDGHRDATASAGTAEDWRRYGRTITPLYAPSPLGEGSGLSDQPQPSVCPNAHPELGAPLDGCPICGQPLRLDDLCASDVTEGPCHAACLEGSPVVDLDSGEEMGGKIETYRYAEIYPPVAVQLVGFLKDRDEALFAVPPEADEAERLTSALAMLEMMRALPTPAHPDQQSPLDGWQEIATAPKDGSVFLAWPGELEGCTAAVPASWYVHPSVSGWVTTAFDCNEFEFEPTHWMPLPPSPDTPTASGRALGREDGLATEGEDHE